MLYIFIFNVSFPFRGRRNRYVGHGFLRLFGKKTVRRPQQVRGYRFGQCPGRFLQRSEKVFKVFGNDSYQSAEMIISNILKIWYRKCWKYYAKSATLLFKVANFDMWSCRLLCVKLPTLYIKVGNFAPHSRILCIMKWASFDNIFSTIDSIISVLLILYTQ